MGADALQIYRDLPVLTATPGPTERKGVPHHLVGTVDGSIGWSVGRWLTAANIRIAKLQEAGVDVIVVGGTGLYLEALVKGIAEIPPVSSQVRAQATEEFAQMGEAAFRARLAGVDELLSVARYPEPLAPVAAAESQLSGWRGPRRRTATTLAFEWRTPVTRVGRGRRRTR